MHPFRWILLSIVDGPSPDLKELRSDTCTNNRKLDLGSVLVMTSFPVRLYPVESVGDVVGAAALARWEVDRSEKDCFEWSGQRRLRRGSLSPRETLI